MGQGAGTGQVIVVMGVAGSGKTSVGRLLADALGVPYAEGDTFHPAANVAKIAGGTLLDDSDRWPWLDAVGAWIGGRAAGAGGGVVSASALKRVYRDRLRAADPGVVFVHLTGERSLIEKRLTRRTGHFMPAALLESQLDALEPLQDDEAGVVVDIAGPPEQVARRALTALRAPAADR
ncbi:gluconokinase [Streptomyces sp. A1136]|uniref:gluconokinase n=1 Tax=Streptomyces sp. A1136 TaxID=2563102 RepID=UPI00109E7D1C|nr:gluconokinase [Streptomyces sp. A1136]THA56653.1 gluconokinase [Streptomyces sp. A1136]